MLEQLNAEQVRQGVIEVLEKTLQIKLKDSNIDMVKNGMIDSLNLVELIVTLEEKFNIEVSFHDLDLEYFKNVDLITQQIMGSTPRIKK